MKKRIILSAYISLVIISALALTPKVSFAEEFVPQSDCITGIDMKKVFLRNACKPKIGYVCEVDCDDPPIIE